MYDKYDIQLKFRYIYRCYHYLLLLDIFNESLVYLFYVTELYDILLENTSAIFYKYSTQLDFYIAYDKYIVILTYLHEILQYCIYVTHPEILI